MKTSEYLRQSICEFLRLQESCKTGELSLQARLEKTVHFTQGLPQVSFMHCTCSECMKPRLCLSMLFPKYLPRVSLPSFALTEVLNNYRHCSQCCRVVGGGGAARSRSVDSRRDLNGKDSKQIGVR